MTAATGATATLRIAGNVVSSEPGVPFWVHGTTGTLRGSVLLDSDRLELDDGDTPHPGAPCPAPGSSTGSPRRWAS